MGREIVLGWTQPEPQIGKGLAIKNAGQRTGSHHRELGRILRSEAIPGRILDDPGDKEDRLIRSAHDDGEPRGCEVVGRCRGPLGSCREPDVLVSAGHGSAQLVAGDAHVEFGCGNAQNLGALAVVVLKAYDHDEIVSSIARGGHRMDEGAEFHGPIITWTNEKELTRRLGARTPGGPPVRG